ncbi:unnamed protein product [Phyllotreta striolata]|uniref:Uncharacterized protein n=1 Tax=Phyllotreta striolata TaxID=444603 RepID=A0A9N9TM83_PHYSR|nr:unnamed protein product [Phyllotreta striolata]
MKIVLLFFLCCTFHAAFSRSLEECPGGAASGTKQDDLVIKANLFETIKVRFPESGDYDNNITCILAIDESNSHSNPVITQGGLGYSFVEITVGPWLLEQLKYRFEIYTG